jgi:hypothetical protein
MGTAKKKPKKSAKKAPSMRAGASTEYQLDTALGVRAFAMSAGDMSVFVMQEVRRVMEEQRFSQTRAIQVGIDRMQKDRHISAQEAKDLKLISRLVLRTTRENADLAEAAMQVRELYQTMAASPDSSPAALAIASAASASLREPEMSAGAQPRAAAAAVVITPGNTGVGAVVGGVIGGVIGGIAGGGLGAGLGAAIGAAAGGAIGFCNEAGV